jgi:excisionase family DNA binding protein
MPEDRLLTIRDVMQRTSLSRSTVTGLLARGELQSLTIGRARRVQSSRLDAWIATCAANEARRHATDAGTGPLTDHRQAAARQSTDDFRG